jgi:hypothetical protein
MRKRGHLMWLALAGAEGDTLGGLTTPLTAETGWPNQDNCFFAARAVIEKKNKFHC